MIKDFTVNTINKGDKKMHKFIGGVSLVATLMGFSAPVNATAEVLRDFKEEGTGNYFDLKQRLRPSQDIIDSYKDQSPKTGKFRLPVDREIDKSFVEEQKKTASEGEILKKQDQKD
tara:strand:+ start:1814 stop:2161 length:348 start_codon:yes stop_codon:yes gene_type:complete